MPAERTCSQCGAPLPSNALGNRCPKCLLGLALEESGVGGGALKSDPSDPSNSAAPKTKALAGPDALLEQPGTVIGRYKLLQEIGEGGFGVVFMAEQTEPVQRKVALKVIKAGMDTREIIARFEAERQALALMDHPNIARVLDGGATASGRPYFVMELVKGVPITDYCDHTNLSTRERLELFIKVCRAVQHAHQKGVIHRDLKPGNVMVTLHDGEPVPKVIDFGVAKALGRKLTEKTLFTRYEQMIGTPAYMSPEQAALSGLDVDTRSDLYSLGVLLYELLTGVTPLDATTLREAALDEVRRMIQETEPPNPSTRLLTLGERLADIAKNRQTEPNSLTRLVRGDLDWITMKALEKDRRRRYETVNDLAADIERHLRDEPVVARSPSAFYRVQKVARRHRVAFAAGAVTTVALVLGAAVSTWLAVRAMRAERQARIAQANETSERKRVEQDAIKTEEVLVDVLKREGKYAQVEQVFDDLLTANLRNQPASARVLRFRAEFFANHGQWKKAAADTAKVLEFEPNDHHNYAALASLLVASDDLEGYRQLCQRILARFGGTNIPAGPERASHPEIYERMAKACLILPSAGVDLESVAQLAETAVEAGRNNSYFPYFQFCKGLAEYRRTSFAAAVDWTRRALVTGGDSWSPFAQVQAYMVLAMAQSQLGHTNEAKTAFEQGIEIERAKSPKLESGDIGGDAGDWMIAHKLMAEAKALIESQPAGASGRRQ